LHYDFKLRITVGTVEMSDILANIETMFKDILTWASQRTIRLPYPLGAIVMS
jgi:hypothetical protein